MKCPKCHTEDSVGAYVNLRRFYAMPTVEDGEVYYEGYGDQVEDTVDYLICNACESTWTEIEFVAAVTL